MLMEKTVANGILWVSSINLFRERAEITPQGGIFLTYC